MKKRTINKRWFVTVPVVFALAFVLLLVHNYIERTQLEIQSEFEQLESSLARSVKIVSSLDYNISSQLFHQAEPEETGVLHHQVEMDDGVCRAWPVMEEKKRGDSSSFVLSVDLDYMVLGSQSLCQTGSPLFRIAKQRVSIAPVISFLHDLDTHIDAVHYVSASKYTITSPEALAKKIDKLTILSVTDLPFWSKTANNADKITVLGPYHWDFMPGSYISLSSPIASDDTYYGAVVVEVSIEKLLRTSSWRSHQYRIINLSTTPLPKNAQHVHKINASGVNFSHAFYYDFDLKREVYRGFIDLQESLLTVLTLLVIAIIAMFYFQSRIENRYFKELAEKDPMTGLWNRRGLEVHCELPTRHKYIAVGVYDIDDFKKINDTYGHDKGDEVLCYVADRIKESVRESDIVARFGGEEFVVYLRGDDSAAMTDVLKRVRLIVTENASQALSNGFTISGGISVSLAKDRVSFSKQFKEADERLYIAKTSGKNQVVV
ncbi:GGDEF domain-containing protein [Vibrio hannami]|uniref:GGDEF domain-containing protein n=1 Tax=Vibrio hannami TaxID=2717094 RepID=UPI003EB6C55D